MDFCYSCASFNGKKNTLKGLCKEGEKKLTLCAICGFLWVDFEGKPIDEPDDIFDRMQQNHRRRQQL